MADSRLTLKNDIKCNICGKSKIKGLRRCPGHGAGSGAGSGSGSEEKTAKHDNVTPEKKRDGQVITDNQLIGIEDAALSSLMKQLKLTNKPDFDLDVILDLILKQALMIESNPDIGIFSIRLRYNPNHLSVEQRNALNYFMFIILNELREFKNNVTKNNFSVEKDGNQNLISLRILLPKDLYNDFIKRLENKSLLPTPFLTKPTPGNNKKSGIEEEVERKSFIRPLSPVDRLKGKRS